MIKVGNHAMSVMVMYVVFLHLSWSLIIWLDPVALHITSIHALYVVVHTPNTLANILMITAIAATLGMVSRNLWALLLVVPQQIILFMTAAGAVTAMYLGQFPDGVVRPHAFMIADQIHSVIAAVCHTVALIGHVIYRLRDRS